VGVGVGVGVAESSGVFDASGDTVGVVAVSPVGSVVVGVHDANMGRIITTSNSIHKIFLLISSSKKY